MNWLRYVLLAVCILSALAGYRKGLVRTVLSMVSLILVTGLAIWMNPYVTDVLNERTTLPQYVEKKCLETFENNEFLSGENQDVQKKWLESMGVPEELVNQILGSGAVREYQEEQLHSLASYAAKAVSEKIMKGIAFFLTLVLAVGFVTIAVKIVELIAEIPGICGENCGIDCGDSGDQLFEPHGRSRTWCRACGAVDLDFLCGGVLLSGDTLGECMHEADPGRYGAGMDSGE